MSGVRFSSSFPGLCNKTDLSLPISETFYTYFYSFLKYLFLLNALILNTFAKSGYTSRIFSKFYLKLPEGIVEVFGASIHPSHDFLKNRTTSKGFFFVVRLIDSSFLKNLEKLNINPDKITAAFLTHTDSDHVGTLELFKNADIYISKEEEKMMTS